MNRPIAESCLRNQHAIYDVVNASLPPHSRVLEIGGGTGQHAAYVLSQRPDLHWVCTDVPEMLEGIGAWLADLPAGSQTEVRALDVNLTAQWPAAGSCDWVFMANTLHYVSESCANNMLKCAAHVLVPESEGRGVLIYGPFNEQGRFTSEGNAALDHWLKQRDPESGIKDLEWVQARAARLGLELDQICPMPANNLCLRLQRSEK